MYIKLGSSGIFGVVRGDLGFVLEVLRAIQESTLGNWDFCVSTSLNLNIIVIQIPKLAARPDQNLVPE